MSLLYWDDSFSVKVAEIDTQHKKLFEIVNKLDHQTQQTFQPAEIEKILLELASYADYHFSTEGKYFRDFKYINTEVHEAAHETYKSKINDMYMQFKKSENIGADEIHRFLVTWWITHITQMDHDYVGCFTENGLH